MPDLKDATLEELQTELANREVTITLTREQLALLTRLLREPLAGYMRVRETPQMGGPNLEAESTDVMVGLLRRIVAATHRIRRPEVRDRTATPQSEQEDQMEDVQMVGR